MKTRTRKSPVKTSNNSNIFQVQILLFSSPLILFLIFSDKIADFSMSLYIFLLIFGFPLTYYIYRIFEKININWLNKSVYYGISILALFILFILYIITFWNGFLFILGISGLFLAFLNYLPYLELKHAKKLLLFTNQAKYRGLFKIHLEDKNFLNHHNYFISPKNKEIYSLNTRKNRNLYILISSLIFPLILLLGGMNELFSSNIPWKTFFGMFGVIYITLFTVNIFSYLINSITGKYKSPKVSFYQAKMDTSKFLKYRNKIFFY